MKKVKYVCTKPKKDQQVFKQKDDLSLESKKVMNLDFSKQEKPVKLLKISFDSNKLPVLVPLKILNKDKLHLPASKNLEPMKKLQRFKILETRCNFCNVEFNNNELFKMHMARHTVGRPWTCSRCHIDQKEVCGFFRHIHTGCNIQKC